MKQRIVGVVFCALLTACSSSQNVSLVSPDDGEQFSVQIRAIGDVNVAQENGLFLSHPLAANEGVLYRFHTPVIINFSVAQNSQVFDLFFFTEQGLMAAGWNTEPCVAQPCPVYTSRIPVTNALLMQEGMVSQNAMTGWSLLQ